MFIDRNGKRKQELQRSEMRQSLIRSKIPLLQSSKTFLLAVSYKHFVPSERIARPRCFRR